MKNYIEFLKEYFLGRLDAFGLGIFEPEIEKTDWNVIKSELTDEKIESILNSKDQYIGAYPYYQNSAKNDIARNNYRCKWICIDIDLHRDDFGIPKTDLKGSAKEYRAKLNIELPKLKEKIEILFSRNQEYFLCERKYLYLEKSLHGFHIWIFLEKDTLLKYAYKYASLIRSKLSIFFKKNIEVNPKQKFLKKGQYGNFVKIPKKDQFPYSEIHQLDISPMIKRINRKLKDTPDLNFKNDETDFIKSRTPREAFSHEVESTVNNNLTVKRTFCKKPFPLLPELVKYAESPIAEKCVVNILNGLDLSGDYGNLMRIYVLRLLEPFGFSEKVLVSAFRNQKDFKPNKALYHIRQIRKKNYSAGSCSTIRRIGYCDPTCNRNGAIYDEIRKKEELKQDIHGWNELKNKMIELVKKKGRYFLRKTTRSGTTTQTIQACVLEKKKLLMIAPTIKIFDDTLTKALDLLNLEKPPFKKGKLTYNVQKYRIGSNLDLCEKIRVKYEKTTDLQDVFPFLLKPMCSKCHLKEMCKYVRFLENIDKYDIIYLTTQKYKALVSASTFSERAKNLLEKLIDWSDVIFIDELNHLLTISSQNYQIYGRLKERTEYVDFTKATRNCFKRIHDKIKNEYENNEILAWLARYVNIIEANVENLMKNPNENITIGLDKFGLECFADSDNWIKTYNLLIELYEKTKDKAIKNIVNLFLALSSKSIFLQKRKPYGYIEPIIELGYIDDIKTLFDHLNNIQYKTILITDAVEPLIELDKVFSDLEIVNINDPMNTSKTQTIISVGKTDYTFHINSFKSREKIKNFIKTFGMERNTIIIAPNIITFNKLRYICKQLGFLRETIHNTYFRSSDTIGVESDKRRCLVIGSSYPPHHCYDYIAKEYLRLGLIPDGNYQERGKKLEHYDALSNFFQAISRAKEPDGSIKSEVFVLGIGKHEIKQWFSWLNISTPKVIDIKDYKKEMRLID